MNISPDKALHFIAGMLVVAFVATIIPCIDNCAIIFAIIAGISKEIRDELVYGGFDWQDLVATISGGLVVQLIIWIEV
jgi:hypothetical protein